LATFRITGASSTIMKVFMVPTNIDYLAGILSQQN